MSFKEILNRQIEKTNFRIEEMLLSDDPQMNEVMRWIVADKGKQLRSRILIASANLESASPDVTEFSAMLEILHTATLVHDDVIDNSFMRRGRESVYKKFGTKLAVYAGDYMIFSAFSKTKVSPSFPHKRIYKTLESVCHGELGQNATVSNLEITERQYLNNIKGKTAALFRLACELGASASKMTEKKIDKVCAFGENFGMMFQMYDDLLDFGFGETKIGKPVNLDIVDGVYTLPLIYAMLDKHIKANVVQMIKEIQNGGVTNEISEALKQLIVDSGALQHCKETAASYYRLAFEGLEDFTGGRAYSYLADMLKALNEKIIAFNHK